MFNMYTKALPLTLGPLFFLYIIWNEYKLAIFAKNIGIEALG